MVNLMRKVTFDLSDEIFKLLKLHCIYNNITMKEFLKSAITNKLNKENSHAISMESAHTHQGSDPTTYS